MPRCVSSRGQEFAISFFAVGGSSCRRAPKAACTTRSETRESSAEGAACSETIVDGERRPVAPRNVLGEPLEICSIKPITGFYRDGCCNTGQEDAGSHTVCAVLTTAFLEFSKARGNDLSTPMPELGFSGLRPGDRWCLCAPRWQEALDASRAPRVVLRATHEGALAYCSLADLKRFAIDLA